MQAVSQLKILIVEDLDSDFQFTQDCLETLQLSATRVITIGELAQKVAAEHWDVVLLDLCLPDSKGLDTVKTAKKLLEDAPHDTAPIIVLTGINDFATSKEAIKLGAKDYLIKGEYGPHELNRAMAFATLTYACPKRPPKPRLFGIW